MSAELSDEQIDEVFTKLRYDAGYASHRELVEAIIAATLAAQGAEPSASLCEQLPSGAFVCKKHRGDACFQPCDAITRPLVAAQVEPSDADLCAAADELLGAIDKQTYDEFRRAEWDLPDEHDFSVWITAGQQRALSKAICAAQAVKPIPNLDERRREWFDAFTKDRCGCFFETTLVARWVDEVMEGRDYTPGPGAQVDPGDAREALQELVACKDLKDSFEEAYADLVVAYNAPKDGQRRYEAMTEGYLRRKEAAWARARAALAQGPADAPDAPKEKP